MGSELRLRLLELFRQPSFVVTTLIFPSMFLWFLALPNVKTSAAAQMLMGSFAAFAILSVMVFQFSVYVAQERSSPWSLFLRTLPRPGWQSLLVLVASGLVFAIGAVILVFFTTHVSVSVELPPERWFRLVLSLFVGGLPFAGMGLWLGLVCTPRNVVPVANLVYLPLSFAGGLWIPPQSLPPLVQDLSDYLPTRLYAEIVWAAVRGESPRARDLGVLAIFFLLFAFLAWFFYRRDEGAKFS
ncbi:MAG: ABC transporter permease [Bdellovibrio sp.]